MQHEAIVLIVSGETGKTLVSLKLNGPTTVGQAKAWFAAQKQCTVFFSIRNGHTLSDCAVEDTVALNGGETLVAHTHQLSDARMIGATKYKTDDVVEIVNHDEVGGLPYVGVILHFDHQELALSF